MTNIEWTEETWNPIAGCSVVSPGCTNCYAMQMAARIEKMSPELTCYHGLTKPSRAGPVWTGKVSLASDKTLSKPLRRKKPTMYFVNSMSDLFHEDVPDAWIDRVFAVMALSPQHTFQVLTKRSARMRVHAERRIDDAVHDIGRAMKLDGDKWRGRWQLPLPNVWLGVSCEDQRRADERIPDLLATPAAVRFVSAEPMLGPIDFSCYLGSRHGNSEASRASGLPSRSGWGTDDRTGRDDLARGCATLRQMDRRHEGDFVQTSSGRELDEGISANSINDGQCAGVGAGSSTGMASFQWANTGTSDDQPYQRVQEGQQAGEFGTSNTLRTVDPRSISARQDVPGRREEQQLTSDGCGGFGNSREAASGRASEVDSDGLWRLGSHDLESCAETAPALSWVIVGGESGFDARPMHPDWARSIRDQCTRDGVPFFFKQWGAWAPDDAYKGNPALGVALATQDGRVLTGRDITRNTEGERIWKRGKKVTGRLLDGRIWDQMPSQKVLA